MSCPPEDRNAFEAIVRSVEDNFPSDWRSWEVLDFTYRDLFGEEILPRVDNKIRFAIPTYDLARAFLPSSNTSLSERKYRTIRARLLQWPLGRALLYAPHAIMEMVHGSGKEYFKFMDAVRSMKSKLKTRRSVSAEWRSSYVESSPASPSSEAHKRKMSENSREEIDNSPPRKRSAEGQGGTEHLLVSVLNQQVELFNKLLSNQSEQNEKIDKLLSTASHEKPAPPSNADLNSSYDSVPDSTFEEEAETPPSPQGWTHSSRESELREKISEAQRELAALHSEGDIDFNFDPHTTESEPKIAQADPIFVEQGIRCQRFGKAGWRNIKFNDIQKQFQASPAFCALKVNSLLARVSPQWKSASHLEKFDLTLGAISHGLLQQRQIFKEICDKLPQTSKSSVKSDFLKADSSFKRKSDDLLQYVCGRRAEVLEARRNMFRTKNRVLGEILRDIPPSEVHLFSDSALSQAIKDCTNTDVLKFFPSAAFGRKTHYKVAKSGKERHPSTATKSSNFHRKIPARPPRAAPAQQPHQGYRKHYQQPQQQQQQKPNRK